MDPQLSLPQAREIARLRGRHPGAELRVHRRSWGLILEARRGSRTLELERFDWSGTIMREQRIGSAG